MKLLITLLLLIPSLSFSKLISIKEYVNKTINFDAKEVLYLDIRCFALVSYLTTDSLNSELIEEHEDMKGIFAFYGIKTRQELVPFESEDDSISYFTKEVRGIVDEMLFDAEQMFKETGQVYEKSLKDDYAMCKQAYNQLKTTRSL